MVHIRELSLAALLMAVPACALYSKTSSVQILDAKSFEKEILQSDNAAIVEFFAPWCGHCKNLAPHYDKAATNLKGIAKVAAVDCDDEKNKPLCGSQGIKGFPTLKIFKPTSKKGRPSVEDYQGPRTAKAIVDAVVERIPNHITRLSSDKVNDWLQRNNATTKGILFTPKGTTSALYRALAIDFLGRAEFAQIRDKEEDAVKLFGVEKFPTFIVLPGGDAPGKVYEGSMKIDALKEFVGGIVPAKKDTKKSPKKETKKEEVQEESTEAPRPVEEPPKVALIIPELSDEKSLANTCFSPTSKTCVLAIVPSSTIDPAEDPSLAGLNSANEKISSTTKTFRFFKVPSGSAHGKALVEALNLNVSIEKPTVIAVNGHRRWYRVFSGNTDAEGLLAWLDAVTMGDVKRSKLPKELFNAAAAEEEAPVPPVAEESPAEDVPPAVAEETKPETPEHEEL